MTKVSIIQPRTNRVSVNEQERNTIRSIGLAGGGGGGADVGPVYGKTNAAFTQANSAFVQANLAFAQANTANVLAFRASANAASAFAQANNAFNAANTAIGNPAQIISTNGPTLSVNYSLSNYAIINLGHNVTAFSVTSWPVVPARLTLEIRNTGSFNITFPTGYLSLGGQPVLTTGAGKKDVVVLTSAETGANVFVHVVGQNYILL